MENEKDLEEKIIKTTNSDKEEIIIEEIEDNDDDNEFLKSLEKIDSESEEDEENHEDDENKNKEDEELKLKNKNAEEARKRREAEARAKAEAKAKEEADLKKKEEENKTSKDEEAKNQEPQQQVRELVKKYPDLDLGELDKNEDFQEYLQGKWVKGGKTITEIYEGFVNYKARLSKQDKAEVEKQYKKSTPNLKGSSGATGGNTKVEEVYSQEELQKLSERMPYMSPQEYEKIEAKFDRSVAFYKKK